MRLFLQKLFTKSDLEVPCTTDDRVNERNDYLTMIWEEKMSFTYVLGLLGGLALFLYGMQMMSVGLEATAGNKLKVILEKITSNRIVGVFMGAVITAIIQSSSATTVMVVGFVNSGMMTLRQAVWIIMGANIGTTITGQLIALDMGEIAPLIAFAGVALVVFLKNEKLHHIGEILAGLGILFIGMDMMGSAMKPLADNEAFVGILSKFENPILGIAAGTGFTALIQSSSASVGILQALAKNGVVTLAQAAFVLFGQNIGTCVTALLASVGASRNARRATLVHIMFNVIGTCVFTVLCLVTPLISWVADFTPGNAPQQIANLHTLFNLLTTALLLPLGGYLAKLTTRILKEKEEESGAMHVQYLLDVKHIDTDKISVSMLCQDSIKREIVRMLQMAGENVHDAFDVFSGTSVEKHKQIEEREEYVDFLNKEISAYITSVVSHENTSQGGRTLNALYTVTSNVERISDHAINIADYIKMISAKQISFSEQAKAEVAQLQSICDDMMSVLFSDRMKTLDKHERVVALEQRMDDITVEFRNNMFERLRLGSCSDEGSVLFSEMLTDFERIGDHALNISDEMLKIEWNMH